MKKRIVIITLCALLLVSLFPGGAAKADDHLDCIAVNDYLPPELINVIVYYGGLTYVPYWLFANYSLGVYYTILYSNTTACLYNGEKEIFFELSTGRTYDGSYNEYSASAILWGGTVYLPLGFVASYFGTFTYRVAGRDEVGSILRICTGTEVLSDDEFFRAAEAVMWRYAQARQSGGTGQVEPPAPTPTERPSRMGDTVRLGLDGLPPEATLELLRRQEVRVCFFLKPDEILSDPDLIRQISCEGHMLGVCSPGGDESECGYAAGLIWEICRVRSILAAMPESAVQSDRFVVFPTARPEEPMEAQETVYSVTSKLDMRAGDQTIIFPTGDDNVTMLRMLLNYLKELDFSVTAIRETDGGGTPIIP